MKTILIQVIFFLCLSPNVIGQGLCDMPISVECGLSEQFNNETFTFSAGSYCAGGSYNSSEIVFVLNPSQTEQYTIVMSNITSGNLDMFLLDSSCDANTCIAHTAGQMPSDQIVVTLTAGNTYYLVVDGDINGAGEPVVSDFNLEIECETLNDCMASFTYEEDPCGKIQFVNTSIGSNLSYLWIINGVQYTVQDPCVFFPSNAAINVSLQINNVNCEDVVNDIINLELPNNPPVVNCPNNLTVDASSDPNCLAEVELEPLVIQDDDGTTTECFLDGVSVPSPTNSLSLPVGVYNVSYIVTDECENTAECAYTITVECEDELFCDCCPNGPQWNFTDVTSSVPVGNQFQAPWQTEYGAPTYEPEGCADAGSIAVYGSNLGSPGSAVKYAPTGFAGPSIIFQKDTTYCISYCYRVAEGGIGGSSSGSIILRASNTPQTGGSCTGVCNQINISPSRTVTDGWQTEQFLWTSDDDYFELVVSTNISSPIDAPPPMLFDNLCINKYVKSCEADFTTTQDDCGGITFTDASCGDNVIANWSINGSTYSGSTVSFSVPGTYTVTLAISSADGCSDTIGPLTFMTTGDITPPVISCPSDMTITGTEINGVCVVDYTVPVVPVSEPTLVCEYNGSVINAGDILQLPAGTHSFMCSAIDECGNDAEPCAYTITVECEAMMPCDQASIGGSIGPSPVSQDTCCWEVSVGNGFDGNYFKGITIEAPAPTILLQVTAAPGWILGPFTPQEATLKLNGGGNIPLGPSFIATVCIDNYNTIPQPLDLHWLVDQNGICIEECTSEIFFECPLPPPPPQNKCLEMVQDSIDCNTEMYCIKVKNNTAPAFDINSVTLINITPGNLNPSSQSIPLLTSGSTSDWICMTYSGVIPGDNLCYDLTGHFVDNNGNYLACCSDTTTYCKTIPECDDCECADGSISGPTLISNGDFELGNVGFASDYSVGPPTLGVGDFDVRSPLLLGNAGWTCVNHTTGNNLGDFLVADGPNPTAAVWRQIVSVTPGTTYNFCGWFNNLVNMTLVDPDGPDVEVRVNGTTIIGPVLITQLPDNWIRLTGSWIAPSAVTNATIEIFNVSTGVYADLAIDDLSFISCGVSDTCCQDEDAFCDLVDLGWQVTVDGCEVKVLSDQFTDCHFMYNQGPDWGDGTILLPATNPANGCFTHTYTQSGTYNICATIFEQNSMGEECWSKQMCIEVEVDCGCEPTDDCLDILNVTVKDSICELDECYVNPFCQTWLRTLIDNSTLNGCQPLFDYYEFRRGLWNGQTVFVGFIAGAPDGGQYTVFACDGTIIQHCEDVFGFTCNPDAGIDLSVDITAYNVIWSCGDVLPDLADCGSGNECAGDPFCKVWLRDKIDNIINSGCGFPSNVFEFDVATWNGQTIIIERETGVPDFSRTTFYLCSGTIIQECIANFPPQPCVPDAGITVASLTSISRIWECGDPLPFSGLCEEEYQCATYCIEVLNKTNPQRTVDKIKVTPQLGTSIKINPNPIMLVPPLGPGLTRTVEFTICGSDIDEGDIVKFDVGLEDSGDDWCCYSTTPLCLEIPECPPDELCCQDEDAFCDLVDLGWTVTVTGCDVKVFADQFTDCHYMNNLSPDWGDGSILLPAVGPANGCWTHTYVQSGTYNICATIVERNDQGNECWFKNICVEVTVDCGVQSCDPCANKSADDNLATGHNTVMLDATADGFSTSFMVGSAEDGNGTSMSAGVAGTAFEPSFSQSLIDFDLDQINCVGATILNAELQLYADPTTSGHTTNNINCVTLFGVSSTWSETSLGFPSPNPANAVVLNSPSAIYQDYTINVTQIVQDMINNPSAYFGFTLVQNGCTSDERYIFATRENTDASLRPKLLITYDLQNCNQTSDCCYALDITSSCPDPKFVKLKLRSVTPGVEIGSYYTAAPFQLDWTTTRIAVDEVDWVYNSGQLPSGNYNQLINYCLTDIDLGESPQNVILDWYVLDSNGLDSLACSDNFQYNCMAVNDPCPNTDPCDDVSVDLRDDPVNTTQCCYIGEISNQYCDVYFKGVKIEVAAPATISQVQALNGWTINQLNPTQAEVYPSGAYVGMGVQDAFRVCHENDGSIFTIKVSWLYADDQNNCIEICESEFQRSCTAQGGCIEIVQDSLDCENDIYCFRVVNNTDPEIVLKSVEFIQLSPLGANLTPNPYSITPLIKGDTSEWVCVDYDMAGDSTMCFLLVGHEADLPAGEPITWCCVDDAKYFINLEDCPPTGGCPPDSTACENIDIRLVSDPVSGSECCFIGSVDNNYCADYFKGVKIKTQSPISISSVQALNGWIINQINSQEAEIYPPSTHVPLGLLDVFSVCNTTNSNSFNVDVSWLIDDGFGNCIEICNETIDLSCGTGNGDPKCIELVQDSIDCDNEMYCFKIKNNTSPGFTISSVDFIGVTPSGALFNPNPVGILPLAPGMISDWICVSYQNVNVGDDMCFYVVGHKEDVSQGQIPTWCCADTVEHCFTVPECPIDPPVDSECIIVTEDNFDCDMDSYCFKIENRTRDNYNITSLDFLNFNLTGAIISPAPLSIPPLNPGQESDWICVTYSGVSAGENLCFDIVAHKEDIAAGESVTFCCTNKVQHCITIPSCPQLCCDDEQDFIDRIDMGFDLQVDPSNCSVTVTTTQFDSCHWMTMAEPDWGDGSVASQVIIPADGTWTHQYNTSGFYSICAQIFEGADENTVCWDTTMCVDVNLECNIPCVTGEIEVPNGLTPNGDGLNDLLKIDLDDDCGDFRMTVYNRWGQVVYATERYENDWSGLSLNGKELPNGTYFIVAGYVNDDRIGNNIRTYIDIRR